jgi:hypothetical protein
MKSTILILLFAFSLLTINKRDQQLNTSTNSSDSSKNISKKIFTSCIKDFDTTKCKQDLLLRKVASCSWGTYKFISNKYILRINTELFTQRLENYYEVNVDNSNTKNIAELLVYDKLDATLNNICTDMGDLSSPKASRHLKPQSGRLFIGFITPINSFDQFDVSILIKQLVFIDPITKQTINIDKEVIWKVFYDGIPG